MRHSWLINTTLLPDGCKKSIKTHLLDSMAFQYTRNRRTSECCIGSSKNISTFIDSLQSNHLNNQMTKKKKRKKYISNESIWSNTFMVIEDIQTQTKRAQCLCGVGMLLDLAHTRAHADSCPYISSHFSLASDL